MTTPERYTAEQMLERAAWLNPDKELSGMLTQAATEATRLQSLEAENARLRELLKLAHRQFMPPKSKQEQILGVEIRNALKED